MSIKKYFLEVVCSDALRSLLEELDMLDSNNVYTTFEYCHATICAMHNALRVATHRCIEKELEIIPMSWQKMCDVRVRLHFIE
jgi:hypothetical protein